MQANQPLDCPEDRVDHELQIQIRIASQTTSGLLVGWDRPQITNCKQASELRFALKANLPPDCP